MVRALLAHTQRMTADACVDGFTISSMTQPGTLLELCAPAKCGSTEWLSLIHFHQHTSPGAESTLAVPGRASDTCRRNGSRLRRAARRARRSVTTHRLLLVRNPWERLLSAFLDQA